MTDLPLARKAAYVLFCSSLVILTGCNKQPDASSTAPASASSTAPQAAPYTPPTADQLYQMVAPIALFPDNLVAQVLAGATYPDQITAANNWLAQNPNLKGAAVQTAIVSEPWDPSVKGLTAFPSVLDQMAQNIQWTTALGEAYVNDPTDVMNAIQVMRQRAAQHGNLQSSAQQRVVTQPVAAADTTYVDNGDNGEPPVYSGPSVVPAPDQAIEILPAQEDTVYVPSYNPQTVYGEEIPAYPDYTYVQPGYSTGDIVAVGAVTFGVAILVGSLFNHHHDHYNNPPPAWGWNNWGMRWGGGRGGNGGGGGWQRPTVVYNNSTYVSRSTTVVNHYTTNNYNNRTVNNVNSNNRTFNNNVPNTAAQNRNFNNAAANHVVTNAPQAMMNRPAAQGAPMTVPHFGTPVRGAQPTRNEPATAMQAYHAAAQSTSRSDIPSRAALQPHVAQGPQAHTPQVYSPQVHNSTLMRTTPQASPSMVTQPRPQPQMRVQQAPHSTQPAVTHQPTPQVFNRPQPERVAPAPRAQPQTAPRPAPAPRPEPTRAPPAEHNNARPAPPPQHAPSKPVKKDDNQNGH